MLCVNAPAPLLSASSPLDLSARSPRRPAVARARRVLLLLAGLWILNFFDLSMTLHAAASGVLDEQNPLARAALERGTNVLAAGKLAALFGATWVLFQFRGRRLTELASAFLMVVYVGVAVQWKLCYDMYSVTHGAADSEEIVMVDAVLRYLPLF
jgi:hypothetical protein